LLDFDFDFDSELDSDLDFASTEGDPPCPHPSSPH